MQNNRKKEISSKPCNAVEKIIDDISYYIALKIFNYVTANQVTVGTFVVFAIPAFIFLSLGYHKTALVLCGLRLLFDYVDGKVARLRYERSGKGHLLDLAIDDLTLKLILCGACISILPEHYLLASFFFFTTNIHDSLITEITAKMTKEDMLKPRYGLERIIFPQKGLYQFIFNYRYFMVIGLLTNLVFAMKLIIVTHLFKCAVIYYRRLR